MIAEPQTRPEPAEIDAERVAVWLRANPEFLAERPALYATLAPPVRVHGPILADHMAAMLHCARVRAAEAEGRARDLLAAGRTSAGVAERVQEAVVALVAAPDAAECVVETWPGILGIDAAALCCETLRPRWRTLPAGAVAALLRQRALIYRDRPGDAPLLHAEAAMLAERDMLIALPGTALLALVSRDPGALPQTSAWAFLGRALAARLGR